MECAATARRCRDSLGSFCAFRPAIAKMLAMRLLGLVLLSSLALGLGACGGSKPSPESTVSSEPVPSAYRVQFTTRKGVFTVQVNKEWAPEAAERFYRLVRLRFYDEARFFRVVRGFVVQFGINGDPAVEARWRSMTIQDDPALQSNTRGRITFATSGPNTRTTQVFVNLADNARLDARGFAPFGEVVEGMDVVDRLYDAYGDGPPQGVGPDQEQIETKGNTYLEANFPRLDFIQSARVLPAR
jgi:peptidyl-prolyl cis-trans isomerase A (cyclophilin A)